MRYIAQIHVSNSDAFLMTLSLPAKDAHLQFAGQIETAIRREEMLDLGTNEDGEYIVLNPKHIVGFVLKKAEEDTQ